jgi:hypothetical protein
LICRHSGTRCLFHLHRQVHCVGAFQPTQYHPKRWPDLKQRRQPPSTQAYGKDTTTYNTIVLTCHLMAHSDTSHISSTYQTAASMWVVTLSDLLCNRTYTYPVTLLLIGLGYFRAKPFPVWIPQLFSNLVIIHLLAYEDGRDRVFRNVGI